MIQTQVHHFANATIFEGHLVFEHACIHHITPRLLLLAAYQDDEADPLPKKGAGVLSDEVRVALDGVDCNLTASLRTLASG